MNEVQKHHNLVDRMELGILEMGGERQTTMAGSLDFPVKHHFAPGIYAREIFMPAGGVVVSKIHKTEHFFVVIQGSALVWDAGKSTRISAPFLGITKPGTRRVLYIEEDCIWVTFHATHLTDPIAIEKEIIEPHVNPLMADKIGESE